MYFWRFDFLQTTGGLMIFDKTIYRVDKFLVKNHPPPIVDVNYELSLLSERQDI